MNNYTGNKILLVDDDPHIINNMADILSESNPDYIFYQSNCGNIAFKTAKNMIPDLIITDWDMPGLNGIGLIKKLKADKTTKEIPVIMATAVMQSPKDLKSALEAGAADYIRKPINEIELIARVQSVIRISNYNKKIIENKNREIAENALMLIRNNKFNLKIVKKLEELKEKSGCKDKETQKLIEHITDCINEKVKQDSWQKFNLIMKSTNSSFNEKLLDKFPHLTGSDINLCSFLRLGMNSKEISAVLFQSVESVKVARSRLRKKLNLKPEQNLTAFLSSL